MNRRNFLFTLPALAMGAELLIPKRAFFLPPRGGWFAPARWAVKTEGGYFYSKQLADFVRNRRYDPYPIFSLGDGELHLTPVEGPGPLRDFQYRRWSGDLADRTYSWDPGIILHTAAEHA